MRLKLTKMNYMIMPGIKKAKIGFKTMPKKKVLKYIDNVIANTCEQFNISMDQIKSKSRKNEIVIPRLLTMHILRSNTLLTLDEIGIAFNRDHTTVISAIRSTNNMLETDCNIKEEYQKLVMKL
jgi:chromosomal replication initiator protein